jgi:radical SAM superfamily enzyme
VIFGLPGEVDEDARDMALTINSLPIDSAKLHHLHVLKNTELENQYRRGEFQPLSLEAYAQRVAVFLRYLSPRVSIHRLVAFASRWDELVAPAWTTDRLRPHQYIIDYMKSIGARQGELSQEAPSVMMGP